MKSESVMKTIEEFRYEINQVENILLTIILLREDYKFFFNQSKELIESVLVTYRKISRIKLATLRYLNLEILILLDKRESHGLKKFLNKMINNFVRCPYERIFISVKVFMC